ncbi:DUF1232 domain-containing protein [Pelotomaculum sp. PtaB.Bin117]|uniref:YkvA family protein n=1 Tax=Pelotomaculum sp. PtaB.Bin117 TaxID=1811694 RepID=UPI0009D3D74A|nr:DUF1232 domain-containing protein [Pelotomaculum sp. PtaB.Bin117]OPX85906.1 MAG: hypothetical protein A4E54_02198 [Pelotomaculum sp. PtaB.Bin117]
MKSLWYWIKRLKSDIFTLYYASKDPRVPWRAKALLMLLAAYVISPVDFLPDFVIPGLGYIDDMLLIPLGAEFILKMIPAPVVSEAHFKAMHLVRKAKIWTDAVLVFAVILLVLFFAYKCG